MNPRPDFWKGKKVFLTGHTGFKGSWMAIWLNAMGAKTMGYSLEAPSTPSLFEVAKVSEFCQTQIADIRDLSTLTKAIAGFEPDLVIHMAAQSLVRPSYEAPVETYATNVMGTVHLLEACRNKKNLKAIVNVTSDKCYENRELNLPFKESDPMGGLDPYSSSKGCAELVARAYFHSFFKKTNQGLASVRAGNVIGGGDWAVDRLIPDCVRALAKQEIVAIRNPQSLRPWQLVLEPLCGYLLVAEKLWQDPSTYSQGWNFGPELEDIKPVSWLSDQMIKQWGSGTWQDVSDASQPHEAKVLKLDSALAQQKLQWRPRYKLPQAIEKSVDWYKRFYQGESAHRLCLEQIDAYVRMEGS